MLTVRGLVVEVGGKRIVDKGNQDARDSMETLARGWSVSQEPQDQLMRAPDRPQ